MMGERAPLSTEEESEKSVNPKKSGDYVPDNKDKGNSDKITRAYFDSMLLVYKHIGAEPPVSTTTILGQPCATPIMASTLSRLGQMREDGFAEFARGIRRAGTLMWTAWMDAETFRAVCDTGARVVRGIKPFQDNELVYKAMEEAAACGAVACCMDIDHCFDDTGKDCDFGYAHLGHKTVDDLKGFAAAASAKGMPFIIKGILDPEDAKLAKEIGAGGIVVSHHKGIWSYAAPPAMMLPEIRAVVGEEYPVFADCGLHSGVDVFKTLAVGANAVGLARELMSAFHKKGADGVYDRIQFLNDELLGTMAKTHCAGIEEITPSAIRMRNGW
ncbi:MAG: alpha-hydroxy-acid oxidizing protein [Clostridiales bacterium]|nr:alpha-hydroxy-acid oxidizing protein [Clostridiales bacterium]